MTIFSPIDGHPITMYDTVSAAAQQAVKNVDTNDPNLTQRYDGFEINFNARLPKRGRIFGGSATDRPIANACSAAATNPNLLNYCDQTQSGIPWRTQFKLVATYQSRGAFKSAAHSRASPAISTTLRSYRRSRHGGTGTPEPDERQRFGIHHHGRADNPLRRVSRATPPPPDAPSERCIVPGMNSASFSVPLVAPSTENTPRITQLDLAVSKRMTVKRIKLEPKIDVFNVLNSSDYFSVRTTTFSPTAVRRRFGARDRRHTGGVPCAVQHPAGPAASGRHQRELVVQRVTR